MLSKFPHLLYSFVLLSLLGCENTPKQDNPPPPELVISDFSTENEYTSGIEGPEIGVNYIYAVNFDHEGSIGRTNFIGQSELFIDLPTGSTGNGIKFGNDGFMYVADYSGHNILKIDTTTKEIEVYAHDSTLNQPNDLYFGANDIIYCSDPNWKESTGKLWKVNNGQFQLIEDSMGTTNGIATNPDNTYLFVNESIQRNVWRYDLDKKGDISNKKLIHTFENAGLDGMQCDSKGNIWITRYDAGEVVIMSSEGELLQSFPLKGKKPTNVALKETDKYIEAYITLQDRGCFEQIYVTKEKLSYE